MHDFQRDVSHLERLAELWLRSHASAVPTSAWEWTSDRRGISPKVRSLWVGIFEKTRSRYTFAEREERGRPGHERLRSKANLCDGATCANARVGRFRASEPKYTEKMSQ